MQIELNVAQSADLLAVLFSEFDLLDDAEVPEVALVVLPFVPAEDDEDSDLLPASDVDVSDFEDSAFAESALADESALAASTFEVSPFDLA
jgi:hypothetical protein